MRLLYVCSDFGIPPDGTKGPSIHLRSITRALCQAGCESWLLSPKDGPGPRHPLRRLLPPGCPPADREARRLKQWLLSHGLGEGLGQELRPLFYNAWVHEPALRALRERPVDVILERLSLFGCVGLDLAEACNVPLVLEVNALLTDEARRFRTLQLAGLAEAIETRVLQHADAITVVSQQLAQQVVACGIDAAKVQVVPNGVDVELFEQAPPRDACRAEHGLGDEFVIGFVGSLKVWHGADLLLEAFRRFRRHDPAAKLLIVGTGPMEAHLRENARLAELDDAVTFTGAVEHERVPRLVRAMDVAVAPFLPFEGFYFSPIKLYEYMAAGAAVVASRLGQIAEVIEDGVNGLLCEPASADDVCRKLLQLRESPALRARLAASAGRAVRERHTWAHAARKVVCLLNDVVERRAARSARREPRAAAAVGVAS